VTTVGTDGDRAPLRTGRVTKEGVLTDENEEMVTLKNGTRFDAGLTRAAYQTLDAFLEREPELFGSLLALARDQQDAVPADHITRLRAALLVRPDGTLVPVVREVLLSAYRDTPDGPALVHPVRFASAEEVAREERAEEASWNWLNRWLREDDTPGSDDTPGRG
jgi:hypothetical protein